MTYLKSPLLLLSFLLFGCGGSSVGNENLSGSEPMEVFESHGGEIASADPAEESVQTDGASAKAPDGSAGEGTEPLEDTKEVGSSNPCTFPLVELQTGKDTSCAGGNSHFWPIGMAPTDCHAWEAQDGSHLNSAMDIRCKDDGSFEFTQYAGNLNCEGEGVVKTFEQGVCEQDIPPVLYTLPINLACCTSLDHPECVVGIPSVSIEGGSISLNGELCVE